MADERFFTGLLGTVNSQPSYLMLGTYTDLHQARIPHGQGRAVFVATGLSYANVMSAGCLAVLQGTGRGRAFVASSGAGKAVIS